MHLEKMFQEVVLKDPKPLNPHRVDYKWKKFGLQKARKRFPYD